MTHDNAEGAHRLNNQSDRRKIWQYPGKCFYRIHFDLADTLRSIGICLHLKYHVDCGNRNRHRKPNY